MAAHYRFGPNIATNQDAQLPSSRQNPWESRQPVPSAENARFLGVPQPVAATDRHERPRPPTNGTHSESLTTLQAGYLRAISALEAQNKALQQQLDAARNPQARHTDQGHRMFQLQKHNNQLQRELILLRARPDNDNEDTTSLELKLADKTERIKEKNTAILQRDETIRRLQAELIAERNNNASASHGTGTRVAVPPRRNGNVAYAQKKRKMDPPPGSQYNPFEL